MGGVDWIGLAQDRDRWKALVNVIRTFGFSKMLEHFLVTAQLAACRETLSFMKLVGL
jgi:hypothetical protein